MRFLRATADASKFYFDQKEKTLDIMTEYLGRPRDETEYAYNQFKRWTDKVHRPQVETIKTTLEAIKKNTPKAARQRRLVYRHQHRRPVGQRRILQIAGVADASTDSLKLVRTS